MLGVIFGVIDKIESLHNEMQVDQVETLIIYSLSVV